MQQTRATSADDAYWAFDPFAVVRPDDLWYEDLGARLDSRRYGLSRRLLRHLEPAPNAPDFVQIAILGQSGVGKTTQVLGAIDALPDNQVFVVVIDALSELDPADIEFADILFTLARSTLVALDNAGFDVPKQEAEVLRDYFDDETYVRRRPTAAPPPSRAASRPSRASRSSAASSPGSERA